MAMGCLGACECPTCQPISITPSPPQHLSFPASQISSSRQHHLYCLTSLLNHYHTHHQQDYHTNTNMSSPAAQYVYIPNLVGRQMLRIPLEDVEVDDMVSYTPASSQTTSTTSSPSPPPFARTVSRSPSISSVESTE
jgi:hypothetical protein